MTKLKKLDNFVAALVSFETRLLGAMQHGQIGNDGGENNKSLQELFNDFTVFKKEVLDCISDLHEAIKQLSYEVDEQQAYTRKNCLLLHGLPEAKNEDVINTALDFLNSKLNVKNFTFVPEMFDNVHRLGRVTTNAGRGRPVIVKFTSYLVRSVVWKNKRSLKGTNMLVTESLTSIRADLFRKAKDLFGTRNCWTFEGRIIVMFPDQTKKVVTTMEELDQVKDILKRKKSDRMDAVKGVMSRGEGFDSQILVDNSVSDRVVNSVSGEEAKAGPSEDSGSSEGDKDVRRKGAYNMRSKAATANK